MWGVYRLEDKWEGTEELWVTPREQITRSDPPLFIEDAATIEHSK